MSNFTVENQGVNTYLVYKVQLEDEFDSLSFGMLANNKIRGIAPILFTQMDADKYLKYNISSKIPVSQILKGTVNKKRLLSVLSGIASAYIAAEEYMVDTSLFVLDIDHIYVDVTTNETILICLPVLNSSMGSDLQLFFKQFIYSAQFDQTENCDYVAGLINYLNGAQVFSVSDFKALVDNAAFSASAPARSAQPSPLRPAQTPDNPPAAPAYNPPPAPPQVPAQAPAQERVASNPFPSQPPVAAMPPVPKKAEKVKKNKKAPAAPVMPGVAMPGAPAPATPAAAVPPEKQVTLMTLLTKFSKENLELYKAQKADKQKAAPAVPAMPGAPVAAPGKPAKAPKPSKAPKAAPPVGGFAIPGQTPSVNGAPTPVTPPVQPPVKPAATVPAAPPVAVPQPPVMNQVPLSPRKEVVVQSANFGETTVLGATPSAGETTVLGVAPVVAKPVPHLIRIKTGEKIAINKPTFRIGKERSYVDYFISDNTAISRSHADVILRGNSYYLVDLNSTNHTFINEIIIESGTENKINPGDKIRFANEEFDFILI